ncbi:MAG: TatD family hydrolase [Candidatus Wallbacteria bacterium]|nr:TatD family hydrolase [Candidatus Wallbacteria bacterium]
MLLIDTHAHLNMSEFASDLTDVLKRATEAGVETVINVGFDRKSSQETIELADKNPNIFAVIGFHPHEAKGISEDDYSWLKSALSHPKVLALGEIGLDYHYDNSPRDLQRSVFVRQLEMARELGKKIVVHSREAALETREILFEHDGPTLLHCFSGSAEMAEEYLKKGYYLALGGAVTFKNARKPLEVLQRIGAEHLLLETDSPYMTPVPFRGKRNEPALLTLILKRVAEILSMPADQLADKTTGNARHFFEMD